MFKSGYFKTCLMRVEKRREEEKTGLDERSEEKRRGERCNLMIFYGIV